MRMDVVDPFPGRCECIRQVPHSDGHIETLRCLGYAHEAHICEFPAPRHMTSDYESYVWPSRTPKPWVKPEDQPAMGSEQKASVEQAKRRRIR